MSEETATIDPKDVRTQLGLAADAPDADVIVELLKLIAQLTAQIETLPVSKRDGVPFPLQARKPRSL